VIRVALVGWALVVVLVLTQWSSSTNANATPTGEMHPALAICSVFGERYCLQALEVSWCESRFYTDARNGQYLGLFQMGSAERRRYGHGSDAWTQARSARRYFIASGRDWSPWTCKP
jgi:hypothetical protein